MFMEFSRKEYWSGLPFPSPVDHILSDLSTMTCPSWVASWTWLSFIEINKAVVCVIRLASFLWVWFQCVCPLMPLATPTILLGFLLPWMWGISSWLLQQSTAAAPYLGHVVAPHGLHYWPWTGASPLGCFPLQCYVAMYVPIVTLLIVLGLFFRSFFIPFLFCSLVFSA